MLPNKKTLIKHYEEGFLQESAYYNPSAFDVVVIVEMDDETVFGYYQFQKEKKKFFRVKLYYTDEAQFFNLQFTQFYTHLFLKYWRA